MRSAVLAFVLASCAPRPTVVAPPASLPPPPTGSPSAPGGEAEPSIAREIVRWTNVERLARGLGPLEWSHILARAAHAHSEEMVRMGYFSHVSPVPSRRTPMMRVRAAGLRAQSLFVGENIARGTWSAADSRDVIRVWMESPGHRENLLRPNFSYIGVGVVSDGRYLVITQVFASAGS